MLAEVLLVLAGHPSSFFTLSDPPSSSSSSTQNSSSSKPTLRPIPALKAYLHPGEIASLESLADLASAYTSVRAWCRDVIAGTQHAILHQNQRQSKGKGNSLAADAHGHGEGGSGRDIVADVYLSTLAHSILAVLTGYERSIVDLETQVLRMDPGVVQDQETGFVPLSVLVSTFSKWVAPLFSLRDLIDELDPTTASVTPASLMETLRARGDTGNPALSRIYTTLSRSIERLYIRHLITFVLYGQAPTLSTPLNPAVGLDIGPDPLSPRHRVYVLVDGMVPVGFGARGRESLLYVGRVAATLKREGRDLPGGMVGMLKEAFEGVVVDDGEEGDEVIDGREETGGRDNGENETMRWKRAGLGGLEDAIGLARREIGEWLWRYVLTGSQIIDALDSYANYFLTRKADHTLSLIHELDALITRKLILSNPTSSSSLIRDTDLHHAWLRASVGTSAENDKSLDLFRLRLTEGPLRTLPSAGTRRSSNVPGGTSGIFSSIVLGAPIALHPVISWPLDLFLTPPARESYVEIHAFLFALRTTHERCLRCWRGLTARRRGSPIRSKHAAKPAAASKGKVGTTVPAARITGEVKDEDPSHNRTLRELEKTTWTTLKLLLFFLEELLSHFMVDIIDTQHRALLEQLDPHSEEGMKRSGSVPGSLRGSTRYTAHDTRTDTRTEGRREGGGERGTVRPGTASPASTYAAAETVRSRVPPTPNRSTAHLDFLSLRQLHARHLAFLKQGLLIADKELAVLLRDIMEVVTRFTGLIDRLDSGRDVGGTSSQEDHMERLQKQQKQVSEMKEEIHDHLVDFFSALVESQKPVSSSGDSSAPSGSFTRTARAAQIVQSSRIISRQVSFSAKGLGPGSGNKTGGVGMDKVGGKSGEVESMMGRHVEQLLLRLDYNGVFSAWLMDEKATDTTQVLAQGGI